MLFELVWSNKIHMYVLVSSSIPYCVLCSCFHSHFFLLFLCPCYLSPTFLILCFFTFFLSMVSQMVKNLPAVQETWVQALGREDTVKKGMATHSIILAWRIPWTEEPGGLQSVGLQRVGHL